MIKISLNKSWQYRHSDMINKLMLGVCDDWKQVDLPHDYSLELMRTPEAKAGINEGYMQHAGLYYRKEFVVEKDAENKQFWIEIESAAGLTTLWMNGQYISKHLNPYTSILADVSKQIKVGNNELLIYTDNSNKPNSRWYTGCGLTGHVWIYIAEPVAAEPWSTQITTTQLHAENATMHFQTLLRNSDTQAFDADIRVAVTSLDGKLVGEFRRHQHIDPGASMLSGEVDVHGIRPWNPEEPTLYSVSLSVKTDRGEDVTKVRTGIRTITVDPKNGLCINGKTLKLKGGCIHHDLGILGTAAHDAAIRRKIRLLKENGFNALRFAHNPYPKAYFDACDELGLFVVEEAFDEWVLGRTSHGLYSTFEYEWERTLEAMINRDYNHPSIIMWSTGNEVEERDGSADGFAWSARLAQKIRGMDSSRLVTVSACSLPAEYGQQGTGTTGNQALNMAFDNFESGVDIWGDTTERFFLPADVAGYNYKTVRYKHDGQKYPDRIIYGSETYPIAAYDNWQKTMQNDHVIGDFVWTAMDYLGESGVGRYALAEMRIPPAASWPWLTANCGDLDILGHKRPQSYYRDVIWHRDRQPHLFVLPPYITGKPISRMSWTWLPVEANYSYPGSEGKSIQAYIYAYADEVELVQNGVSIGRTAVGHHNEYIAKFDILYIPGMLEAIAFADGMECGREVLRTANKMTRITLEPDQKSIAADGTDLCFIDVTATDDTGTLISAENGSITFTLQGEGTLLCAGNADPMPECALPYYGKQTTFYHGKAMAVVRSAKGAQGAVLTVSHTSGIQTQLAIAYTASQPEENVWVHDAKDGLMNQTIGDLLKDEQMAKILLKALPQLADKTIVNSIQKIPLKRIAAMAPAGTMEQLETALNQALK